MKQEDPVSKIWFFSKYGQGPNRKFILFILRTKSIYRKIDRFKLRKDQSLYARPEYFEELWLRCFTKGKCLYIEENVNLNIKIFYRSY